MNSSPQNNQSLLRYEELPAINKLTMFRRDQLDNFYDPLIFYFSKENQLISVQFEGGIPETIAKYYFAEKKWLALEWESESEAMRNPFGKDYPIRLLKPQQIEETRLEGLKIARESINYRKSFRHILSPLRKILLNYPEIASELIILESVLLKLIQNTVKN